MKFCASTISILALFLFASDCKPGPGSSCDKGDARCVDGKNELVCQDGKFIATPCRGPGGCVLEGESVRCDISKNHDGDTCSTAEEGASACADGQSMLFCHQGKYVSVACRGQNGCENEGEHSHCDQSIATPGDACDSDGSKACSTDSRQVLSCQSGKMAKLFECRGQRGCTSVGGKIDCDLSVAMLGDACDPKVEGAVACAPDAASIVRCASGHFVADDKCKTGTHCETSGTSTSCTK